MDFCIKLLKAERVKQQEREEYKCYDLANVGGNVVLKWAAEDRHRERMSKTCSTAKDYCCHPTNSVKIKA